MNDITKKLIENLNRLMYDEILEQKTDILEVDGKQLIIDLLNDEYLGSRDVSALLKIIPEIWKDFNLSDWQDIIRSVNRPAEYRPNIDTEANFEDIRFLYHWIGIDSLDLYQNTSGISVSNKSILDKKAKYCLVDSDRNGNNYEISFKEGIYGNIQYFRDMKARLISQGAKANSLPDL